MGLKKIHTHTGIATVTSICVCVVYLSAILIGLRVIMSWYNLIAQLMLLVWDGDARSRVINGLTTVNVGHVFGSVLS